MPGACAWRPRGAGRGGRRSHRGHQIRRHDSEGTPDKEARLGGLGSRSQSGSRKGRSPAGEPGRTRRAGEGPAQPAKGRWVVEREPALSKPEVIQSKLSNGPAGGKGWFVHEFSLHTRHVGPSAGPSSAPAGPTHGPGAGGCSTCQNLRGQRLRWTSRPRGWRYGSAS